MYIFVEYEIECAHWLPFVPEDHKCHRMHGHSYKIRIEVEGPVAEDGFVIEYDLLKLDADRVILALDHRTLNDFIENPTCEHLVQHIRRHLPFLTGIEIRETGRAGAGWRSK